MYYYRLYILNAIIIEDNYCRGLSIMLLGEYENYPVDELCR